MSESERVWQRLVDRFLQWPLPQTVCSDLCVTDSAYRFPRSGTNLLNVNEARQMIEYLFAGEALDTARAIGAAEGAEEARSERAAKDAEIAGLRRALGPLARIDCLIDENDPSRGYAFDAWLDGQVVFGIGKERVITAGDLRRARAALNGNGDQTRSE